MKATYKGYLYIIASAVIFGCMPLAAGYIYQDGVNAITLVFLRNLFPLPVLALIAAAKGESFRVRLRDIPLVMIMGLLGCALTALLLFSSYNFMSGGAATVLHFVYPAVVLLIELAVLRSKIRLPGIIGMLLCLGGIATFYTPGEVFSLEGSLLAIASGVVYAVYIFMLGHFGRRGMGLFVFSFFAQLASAAVLLAACMLTGQLRLPTTPGGWILSAVFCLVVNVGAIILFQSGTFIIGGRRAAILSTCEPITSLVAGYIALGESIGIMSVIGSALVIAASVIIAVFDNSENDSPETDESENAEKCKEEFTK